MEQSVYITQSYDHPPKGGHRSNGRCIDLGADAEDTASYSFGGQIGPKRNGSYVSVV
jgi:hypothetical protein